MKFICDYLIQVQATIWGIAIRGGEWGVLSLYVNEVSLLLEKVLRTIRITQAIRGNYHLYVVRLFCRQKGNEINYLVHHFAVIPPTQSHNNDRGVPKFVVVGDIYRTCLLTQQLS